jgi:hypothetical protein
MHAHSIGAIALADLSSCELVVNVFDGGPATRVSYEIAAVSAQAGPLHRAAVSDPYVASLFAEHAAVQKPWVRAVPSSHIWKAPLPAGLRPGAHRVTVKAADEYGRRHSAHLLLEIAGGSQSTA